jgi:proline iminopeptidase
MKNQCFLAPNQLLKDCIRIKDIPTTIVHGRYDIVCPFDNALALHNVLTNSRLDIAEDSGHASAEAGTRSLLIQATQRMLTI